MAFSFRFSRSGAPKQPPRPEESELIVIVDRSVDPHLVVYHDPKSYLSEQYRHFRTNLLALNQDGSPRSLVFASSSKGEGKSVSVQDGESK